MRLSWADEDSSFVYFYDHENYDPIQISLANDRIKREISGELELVEQIGVKNDNKLILGDNLIALNALSKDFAKAQDKDKIKCVYIDPPYNTGLNFRNYSDKLPHSHWLSIMKPRLILLRELMSESGIILIQLDDNEYAHLDILMSEIFSESNRIGTIIWRRRQSQANLSRAMSTIHDYILVYAKNKEQCSIKPFDPLWVDTDKYGHNQIATKEIERELGDRTLFDTPKPKALLENLIQQFTEPGDFVLDCFSGSGTTAICSQKLKRRWIGIELSKNTLELSVQRMKRQINKNKSEQAGFSIYNCSYTESNRDFLKKEAESQNVTQTNKLAVIEDKITLIKTSKTEKNSKNIIIKKYDNELKSIIFSPPYEIQPFINPNIEETEYIDYCQAYFQGLYDVMDESCFILVHSIEPIYSKIKLILNEIFGEKNHVGTVIWRKSQEAFSRKAKDTYDMIAIFCKNIEVMKFYKLEPPQHVYSNPDNDPRGPWVSMPLIASEKSSNPSFTYTFENGIVLTRKFRYPDYSIKKLEEEKRIHFTKPKSGRGIPRVKKFLYERLEKYEKTGAHGYTPNSIYVEEKKKDLFTMIDQKRGSIEKIDGFTQYREQGFYEFLIKITTAKNDWILDCFPQSGSISELVKSMERNLIKIDNEKEWLDLK